MRKVAVLDNRVHYIVHSKRKEPSDTAEELANCYATLRMSKRIRIPDSILREELSDGVGVIVVVAGRSITGLEVAKSPRRSASLRSRSSIVFI